MEKLQLMRFRIQFYVLENFVKIFHFLDLKRISKTIIEQN